MQRTGIDGLLDLLARNGLRQQTTQRGTVQQGERISPAQSAEGNGGKPTQGVGINPERIGTKNLMHMKIPPHVGEASHTLMETRGIDGQRGGVDVARRAAAK